MKAKGGGQEWFYHAPLPEKKQERKLAPPASQIPGLTSEDQEALDRETGTKCVDPNHKCLLLLLKVVLPNGVQINPVNCILDNHITCFIA